MYPYLDREIDAQPEHAVHGMLGEYFKLLESLNALFAVNLAKLRHRVPASRPTAFISSCALT